MIIVSSMQNLSLDTAVCASPQQVSCDVADEAVLGGASVRRHRWPLPRDGGGRLVAVAALPSLGRSGRAGPVHDSLSDRSISRRIRAMTRLLAW